jgi:protein-L-isoaspartate(D-aspartate) O-methyltransferase
MMRAAFVLLAPLAVTGAPAPAPAPIPDRAAEREAMVLAIENLAATAGYPELRRIGRPVLAAMRAVPRHRFVPEAVSRLAYRSEPLAIGHGQTISQPYIVAVMTHLLQAAPGQQILEVGTGSGYQAAVLAAMGADVRSIEIVEPLAREAAERLRTLGYDKVTVRAGDGYAGWPEAAPFDRIIVTAGAPHLPQPLVDQLKPGGRMVIPIAAGREGEELMLVTKDRRGRVRKRALLPVRFVPLTRSRG